MTFLIIEPWTLWQIQRCYLLGHGSCLKFFVIVFLMWITLWKYSLFHKGYIQLIMWKVRGWQAYVDSYFQQWSKEFVLTTVVKSFECEEHCKKQIRIMILWFIWSCQTCSLRTRKLICWSSNFQLLQNLCILLQKVKLHYNKHTEFVKLREFFIKTQEL